MRLKLVFVERSNFKKSIRIVYLFVTAIFYGYILENVLESAESAWNNFLCCEIFLNI